MCPCPNVSQRVRDAQRATVSVSLPYRGHGHGHDG